MYLPKEAPISMVICICILIDVVELINLLENGRSLGLYADHMPGHARSDNHFHLHFLASQMLREYILPIWFSYTDRVTALYWLYYII